MRHDGVTLFADRGPITVVAAWAASEDERERAFSAFEAMGLIGNVCREARLGDRHYLFAIHGLLRGTEIFRGRDVPTELLVADVSSGVADRRLLVLPGWSSAGGSRRTAAVKGAEAKPTREALVATRVMGGREKIEIDGASYRVVPAQSWRAQDDHGSYDVVPAKETGETLKRLQNRAASTDERAALGEAVLLAADRKPPGGGILLVRRRRISVVRSTDDGPAVTPSQLRRAHAEPKHDLLFEYVSNTGHAIADDDGFELRKPGGGIERGKLANGRHEKKGVEPGAYELQVRGIKDASWSASSAHPFEEIRLRVGGQGFPDGTKAKLTIRREWAAPTTAPIVELWADIAGGEAPVPWHYEQKPGEPAHDRVFFEVTIGTKRASSDVLEIVPHPPGTVMGVQDRLRQLGFDPGPPAGQLSPTMRDAILQFQTNNPPLVASGDVDQWTVSLLDEMAAEAH